MRRIRSKQKLKTTITINIACEGITERYYTENLLKEYNLLTSNIKISNLEGKGFTPFISYFEDNKKLFRVFIFIVDLDRAIQIEGEFHKLNKLIDKLENHNVNNTVFLSNPNFEIFVASAMGVEYDELDKMGYKKGNSVYKFIKDNGGSYKKAIDNSNWEFYYDKQDINTKGSKNKENLKINHSNLVYFTDYMKKLLED